MNFRKRMLAALSPMSGLGQDETPSMPDYVGARVGPDGQAYDRVLDDAAPAVGGYLNQYRSAAVQSVPLGAVLHGERVEGGGDLAATIADGSVMNGIAIRGDVTADPNIEVYMGDRLDFVRQNGFYVLSDPPGGWQVGRTGEVLAGELKKAVVGYRAGSVVGGALALAGLAWWSSKRGRR